MLGRQEGEVPRGRPALAFTSAERGWTAPTWARYGGGLSKDEAKVLSQEMAKLRLRPPLMGFGLEMIGPLLLQAGNEEQKREHIRRSSAARSAGARATPSRAPARPGRAPAEGRARRRHFILNGQKVWTSYGDKADWMFILVRTNTEKKHAGITFLLMDMDAPA